MEKKTKIVSKNTNNKRFTSKNNKTIPKKKINQNNKTKRNSINLKNKDNIVPDSNKIKKIKNVDKISENNISKNKKIISKVPNNGISDDIKSNNKRILEIKTTQTGAFKQAIERISGIITECCIVFIPPEINYTESDDEYYEEMSDDDDKHIKDKDNSDNEINNKNNKKKIKNINKKKNEKKTKKNSGGIRILRLTEDSTVLIKLHLDAINFEYFKCTEPKISIGVEMARLNSLLKSIKDDDPIILYMDKNDRSVLHIRSLSENKDNSEETDIEFILEDVENKDISLPPTEFQNKITIASDKFNNICKNLTSNSVYVEITSINNEISFRGKGDGGKVTKIYRDTTTKKRDTSEVVQGIYELKILLGFSKCNKLCNTIDIYLKNDFPLVLVIAVATLGKLYIFLSPIENLKN